MKITVAVGIALMLSISNAYASDHGHDDSVWGSIVSFFGGHHSDTGMCS